MARLEKGLVEMVLGRELTDNGKSLWKVGDDWRVVHTKSYSLGLTTTGEEWKSGEFHVNELALRIYFDNTKISWFVWYKL